MHLVALGPHGILLVLSFIFAVIALVPLPNPRTIPWWEMSWVFFVASCLFGS